jgi:arginyl-tRNA synthetase
MAPLSLSEQLQNLSINPTEKNIKSLTFPNENVVDFYRNLIADKISKVSGIDYNVVYEALETVNSLEKGDLSIPIPRILRGKKGVNPREINHEWAAKLADKDSEFFIPHLKSVKAAEIFIAFYFDQEFIIQNTLPLVLAKNENYGSLKLVENKKIVIEFSSPNIAKPFHAGHLRSTIIGGFLSNLYKFMGWDVVSMNYLGDWGKQFGLLAIGFERYGSEEALLNDPINHLFEVYVKINGDVTKEKEEEIFTEDDPKSTNNLARQYFKRMEDGDEQALKIWSRFRDLSIEKYISTYARLNIAYDVYSGESQVPKEKMDEALKLMHEKDLIHEDRGAKLIDLTKFNKKLGKTLVTKSDGTSLYLTRDVGAAIDRYEKYKFDKMIYVIAMQQDLHTAQFFEILKQLGFEWANRLEHVNFGMVQGMSTRKGTVVFLDNILNDTKDKMHEVMKKNEAKYNQIEDPEKVSDLIGVSAVMIQDMQAKRINNYEFKWERMLSFEGDTGPYLQYAHSRLKSVERNAGALFDELKTTDIDYSLLSEECAANLTRVIAQFPDVLRVAMKNHEPSTICTYLFRLSHQVSSCYDILWVAGQEKDVALARLALYSAARQTLFNGMTLLGLTPVERM